MQCEHDIAVLTSSQGSDAKLTPDKSAASQQHIPPSTTAAVATPQPPEGLSAGAAQIVPYWLSRAYETLLIPISRQLACQFRCVRLQLGDLLLPGWRTPNLELCAYPEEDTYKLSGHQWQMIRSLIQGAELLPCGVAKNGDGSWGLVVRVTWSQAKEGCKVGASPRTARTHD
jgi:hypothetical protein